MIEARCIRDCTFCGRYWRAGEIYRGYIDPPKHFEVLSKTKVETTSEPVEPEEGQGAEPMEEHKTRGRKPKGE